MKKIFSLRFVILVTFIIFLCVLIYHAPKLFSTKTGKSTDRMTPEKNTDTGIVFSITDGDTIWVTIDGKNEPVRLIGIDSPELETDVTKEACYSREAKNRMIELIKNQTIRLESDPSQDNRDKYERLLRYIFLSDGRNINEIMVREGYAWEYTFLGRKYAYYEEFSNAEKSAKSARLGIWSEECK